MVSFQQVSSQIDDILRSRRYLDASNFREKIIARIPEAYGTIKEGTPIHDIIHSVGVEFEEFNHECVEAFDAIRNLLDSLHDFNFNSNLSRGDVEDIIRSNRKHLVQDLEILFKEKKEKQMVKDQSEFLQELQNL